MSEASELLVLLDKDEEVLFAQLGTRLLGETRGMGTDDEIAGKFGRSWFDQRKEELRKLICGHPTVLALLESPNSDRAVQASVLVDILASIEGYAAHAVLIAVLVGKVGLLTFCSTESSKE